MFGSFSCTPLQAYIVVQAGNPKLFNLSEQKLWKVPDDSLCQQHQMHANTNSDYDSHKFPANVSIVQKQHSNTWLVIERKKIREKTQVSGLCCPCYRQQFWSLESLSESPLFPPWSSANVYVSMGILCVWVDSEAELSRWAEHICIFITEHLQHTNLHANTQVMPNLPLE